MNVAKLLNNLSKEGIDLWLEGDELKFSAPSGKFTSEMKDQVKESKTDIISLLKTATGNKKSVIRRISREGPLPLSNGQKTLWSACQILDNTSIYNVVSSSVCEESVGLDVYQRVVDTVLGSQEIFRTRIISSSGEPYVQLSERKSPEICFFDLAAFSQDEAESEIRKIVAYEESYDFNFSKESLARVCLIHTPDGRSVILLNFHHIICDAYSMGLVSKQLSECYEALKNNQDYESIEQEIQFLDFSQWEIDQLAEGEFGKDIEFWKGKLENSPRIMEVETDYPRPVDRKYYGSTISKTLDTETNNRLKELARSNGITYNSLMLAIYKVVLSLYSGKADVVVGTPVANRHHAETRDLVGYFVNTIVMRSSVDFSSSFIGFSKKVHETVIESQVHQKLPLSILLSELNIEKSNSFSPLYQHSFVYANAENVTQDLAKEAEQYTTNDGIVSNAAIDDLSLQIKDWFDGLKVKLTYKTDLFREETIHRMLEHFMFLAECISSNSKISMSQLRKQLPDGQMLLLSESHVHSSGYKKLFPLELSAIAKKNPLSNAVVSKEKSITYEELDKKSNQIANYLSSKGLGCEDAIGLCSERSIEMIAVFLGVMKVGAVFVPIDPRVPTERKQKIQNSSKMKLLILDESSESSKIDHRIDSVGIREVYECGNPSILPERNIELFNTAYILHTSGTTGEPKAIAVSHNGIINLCISQKEIFGVDQESRVLQFASVGFDAWISEVCVTLYSGASLYLYPQDELMPTYGLSKEIADSGITHFTMPPSALSVLPLEGHEGLTVISAGEACSVETAEKWAKKNTFINAYGPSEFTVCSTAYKYDTKNTNNSVSIGKAINNCRVYVCDDNFNRTPIGVRGELSIGGAGLAHCYINNPALTAEKFVPDPFSGIPGARLYCSGDIAKTTDGKNFNFIGRNDDQVNIRGFRVELDEVARTIVQSDGVADCRVVDTMSGNGDRFLVAYFTVEPNSISPTTEQLKTYLMGRLPSYMLPDGFVELSEIPLNINGKVDKSKLPAFTRTMAQPVDENVTSLERRITEICQDVMSVQNIGVNQKFSELGGHSLMISQFSARLQETLGVEIPTRLLFENDSVRQIATLINDGDYQIDREDHEIPKANKYERSQLSLMQQRLWFVCSTDRENPAYNIPVVMRLSSDVSECAIEESLLEIQRRHETLRTTFIEVDGAPQQMIRKKLKLVLNRESLVDVLGTPEGSDQSADIIKGYIGEEVERPFELVRSALIRAKLFVLPKGEKVLCITMHHLISDGWSIGNLIKEFSALLSHDQSASDAALPPLPVQYTDFSAWQRNFVKSKFLERQLTFWETELDGVAPLLPLPIDKARPKVQSHQGSTVIAEIEGDSARAVRALADKQGTSTYTVLLAAFQLLLSKYSNQNDIVVGAPVANRTHSSVESLIGFFVNTIVLRNMINPDYTIDEYLLETRDLCLRAYNNQDIPFELLVEKLNPPRSTSHTPIFQVMFNQENNIAAEDLTGNLEIISVRSENPTSKFDLNVSYSDDRPDKLTFVWEYCTDLFEESTVKSMISHYKNLIQHFTGDGHIQLKNLSLVNSGELSESLKKTRTNDIEIAESALIHHGLESKARENPDLIALEAEEESLSYGELNTKANQLARRLLEAGFSSGDRVAVCLSRSSILPIATIACLKAGLTYVPIDPAYPQKRIAYMLEDSGAAGVIHNDLIVLGDHRDDLIKIDLQKEIVDCSLDSYEGTNVAVNLEQGSLAYIIYTSGSTGDPKGVCVSHRSAVVMLQWAGSYFGEKNLSRTLASTSICFDLSIFELYAPLYNGGTIVLRESVLNLVDNPNINITLLNTVPSALEQLISLGAVPKTTRVVAVAGEALKSNVADAFHQRYPSIKLFNLYGPSEDTTYSTASEIGIDREYGISIGRPISNTQAYILDKYLNPVPPGVEGELYLGGEGVTQGYWLKPELTAERYVPNPFSSSSLGERLYKTSDIVCLMPDNQLKYIGREDRQIKLRGYRVEVSEIESCALKHPSVKNAAVTVHDSKIGDVFVQQLACYYTSTNSIDSDEIRSFLSERIPEYCIPELFMEMTEFPLTPNGKIDYSKLPEPGVCIDTQMDKNDHSSHSSDTASRIASIWSGILSCRSSLLNENSDFFKLGGHSLLALQVVSQIEKRMHIRLTVEQIFNHPTLAQLSKLVDDLRIQGTSTVDASNSDGMNLQSIAEAVSSSAPLSLMQRRLWFIHQMDNTSNKYNLPFVIRIDQELTQARLNEAISRLADRHAVLNSRIKVVDGEPRQFECKDEAVNVNWMSIEGKMEGMTVDLRREFVTRVLGEEIKQPFDLECEKPVRYFVAKVSSEEHYLCITAHHIVTDGWSISILMKDFQKIMEGLDTKSIIFDSDNLVRYAEFSQWQQNNLDGGYYEKDIRFWEEELREAPSVLNLPTDKVRPVVQSHRGAIYQTSVSLERVMALQATNGGTHNSVYMNLLAVFQLLLCKYSGQDDIVVGTPVANRSHAEFEPVVGLFMNTVVLRNCIDQELSVKEYLGRTKDVCLKAFSHQELPFDVLVERINPERSQSHSPIFQVMFGQDELTNDSELGANLTIENISGSRDVSLFDMSVSFQTEGDEVVFSWEYCVDLFEEATIRQMARHFENLVNLFSSNGEKRLKDLCLLDQEEMKTMLVAWNDNGIPTPENPRIHSLFEEQVLKTPERIALRVGGKEYSYRELNEKANMLAHYIGTRGVRSGDRIALCLNRNEWIPIAALACLKMGVAYIPIDPEYPKSRIAYMFEAAEPKLILASEAISSKLFESKVERVNVDTDHFKNILEGSSKTNPEVQNVYGECLAYIMFTSGSTGKPKGVCVQHSATVALIEWARDYFTIDQLSSVLATTSICFDLSAFELFVPLSVGGEVVLEESIVEVAQNPDVCVSLVNTVPSALEQLVKMQGIPASTQLVVVCGEPLKKSVVDAFYKTYQDIRLFNMYGPSEDTTYSTAEEVLPDCKYGVTIGRAINNTQTYVLDKYSNPTPPGVAGELYLAGKGITEGYWRRPDLTADKFIPDPFDLAQGGRMYATSDIVTYTRDGRMLFLGRTDRQVKIRGYRIEIGEVEHAVLKYEGVDQAVVVLKRKREEGSSGEGESYLVCYFVRKDTEVDLQGLREHLVNILPEYFIPSAFVEIDDMPLTPNGKIDQKALPDCDLIVENKSDKEITVPATETESKLNELWKVVLKREKIGCHESFFDLGGHSLLALQLVTAIEEAFATKLSLTELFKRPTISALANYIDTSVESTVNKNGLHSVKHDEEGRYEPFPLTPVQQAYWLGRTEDMKMGGVGTHTYKEIDFDEFDYRKFSNNINILINRHDMLRVIFDENGNQKVLSEKMYEVSFDDISHLTNEDKKKFLLDRREQMSHHVFDPSVWPLFDFKVVKIDEQRTRLYWSLDGLIFDGSSQAILSRELGQLSTNEDASLEPLELTFRDYVLGEQDLTKSQEYQDAKDFWMGKVPTIPLAPEFPLAKDPGEVAKPEFSRRSFTLNKKMWSGLKRKAQERNVTPTVLLMTAFSEILGRWSNSREFSINLTLFNRLPIHPQVNQIIGDFTSLTLMAFDSQSKASFVERCMGAQEQLWSNLDNRLFGGVEVQREVRKFHGGSVDVQFPVIFTSTLGVEESFDKNEPLPTIPKEVFGITQTSQVWLDHQITEVNGGLETNWDAVEELFPEFMLDGMFESYQELIRTLCENDDLWTRSDVVCLPKSQQQIRTWVNATEAKVDSSLLHHGFEKQVQITPDKPAVICSGRTISYRQLECASNAIASELLRSGISRGEPVAVLMQKGWAQVVAVMSILKSGACYLPISPDLPSDRIETILDHAKVERIISFDKSAEEVNSHDRLVLSIADEVWEKDGKEKPIVASSNTDLAYIIFTSGSTGVPKGVMIDHKGAVNTVASINKMYAVSAKDRVLALSSLSFDLSVYDIFGVLGAGGALVLPDEDKTQDPAHWHTLVERYEVSLWNTVPALMQIYVDYCETSSKKLPESIRQVMMSGDWIPLSLPERVWSLSKKAKVDSLGGATEASIWSIFHPIRKLRPQWRSIPYGKPLPNQTYHVLNSQLSPCPDWVPGELYIGGIGVAKGYLGDDEKTKAHFIKDPSTGEILYRTGDFGRYFPGGDIEFLGRQDSQVKVQGYRIELGDIDAALQRHPVISESITNVLSEGNAKQLVSYIVLDEGITKNKAEPGVLTDPIEKALFKSKRKGLRKSLRSKLVVPLERSVLSSGDDASILLDLDHDSRVLIEKTQKDLRSISRLFSCLKSYTLQGKEQAKYFYPSTGSLNAIQAYLQIGSHAVKGVPEGTYYFDPENFSLMSVDEEERSRVTFDSFEFSIHLVMVDAAISPIYGKHSKHLASLESGYMAELLCSKASAIDIHLGEKALRNDLLEQLHLPKGFIPLASLGESRHILHNEDKRCVADFSGEMAVDLKDESIVSQLNLRLTERQSYRSFEGQGVIDLDKICKLFNSIRKKYADNSLYLGLYVKRNKIAGLQEGYYRYCPSTNRLLKADSESIEDAHFRFMGVNELTYLRSSFALFVCSSAEDAQVTVGRLGQAIQVVGSGLDLGFCPVGTINTTGLMSRLGLPNDLHLQHCFLAGKITTEQKSRWEINSGSASDFRESLTMYLEQQLPKYMLPKAIIPMEELPLTTNGKVDRKNLPLPDFQEYKETEHVAPETELQKLIADMWVEILGDINPGIDDSFMESGGSSLSVVQLQTRLRSKLGVDIDLRTLYEKQTLKEQAELISETSDKQALTRKSLNFEEVKRLAEREKVIHLINEMDDHEFYEYMNNINDITDGVMS